jgi:hypothetical protein
MAPGFIDGHGASVPDPPAEQITVTNVVVTAGSRGRYKIYGEAVNNCATELSAILGVTFYDIDGEVIGRASGSVNRLPASEPRPFWLRASNDVSDHATMRVQIDCIL